VYLTYLAILLASLGAAQAASPTPDGGPISPERTKIEAYLATHDLPSIAELRGFAASPDPVLMAIASDARAERLTRARAVAALRFLPSPVVQEFLAKLIRQNAKSTDATVRLLLRRAAVALGWIAGSDAPEHLTLLFANDDAEVRLDAVLGIAMSRGESAADVLRKQLVMETAPRVRDQIRRQLNALGEPPVGEPPVEPAKPPSRKPRREPMRGGL
jgi:hypothetical protein